MTPLLSNLNICRTCLTRGLSGIPVSLASPTLTTLIDDDVNYLTSLLHVGQVTDYLLFDERIRETGTIHHLQAMPLGYLEFASLWNEGVYSGDPRRLSTFFLPEGADQYSITVSTTPIPVADFAISTEQVGLRRTEQAFAPPHTIRSAPPRANASNRDYRDRQFEGHGGNDKRRKNRQGYEKRVERRQRHAGPEPVPTTSTSISDLSRLRLPFRRAATKKESAEFFNPPAKIEGELSQVSSTSPVDDQDATMHEMPADKPLPEGTPAAQ